MRARVFFRSNQLRVEGASQTQLRANNLTTHELFQLFFHTQAMLLSSLADLGGAPAVSEFLVSINRRSRHFALYTPIVNAQHNLDNAFDACQ